MKVDTALENMVSTKQLSRSFTEEAKQKLPKLLSVAKERKVELLKLHFVAESSRLGAFYWQFVVQYSTVLVLMI